MLDLNAAEKQQRHSSRTSSSHSIAEESKTAPGDAAHEVAIQGHLATNQHGEALLQFDPIAERKLRWKIDLYIVPTVAMLYLFCFIDRANVGNAKIAGMSKDLKLKGNDYNIMLSAFYISYIVFEIPANMVCKYVGPGWFIPATSLGFGILSMCTAFVHHLGSASGVRFVLGIFEAGMLPGIAYYLSRWYRRSELAFRLALYLVMAPLAGAFGGLLASAILTMHSVGSLKSWRMIFLVEGLITIGLSIIAFFTLTDRPETARWLSQEEKDLAIARVKSERIGQTKVLDGIDVKKTVRGICSPVTLMVSFIFLCDNVTVQGLGFFAPTIVQTIYPHDSVVSQQLHTVPPYVVGAVINLVVPFLAWKMDRRTIFFILSAPLIMIGYAMFLGTTLQDKDARYGATFLIACGAFTFGALCNAQVSANHVSDTSRAAGIAGNAMLGNIGGLISTWAFLQDDGPNYPIGNGLNLGFSAMTLLTSIVLLLWMKWDNKKRDQVDVDAQLAGLDEQQVEDLDWKHPGFRWKY